MDDADAVLFEGFVGPSESCASALLFLAQLAASRFYLPPGMVAARILAADPVVTVSAQALRFESFSACCGVAARYDLAADGFEGTPAAHGTTNIDLTPTTRETLSRVRGLDPMHLRVAESVTLTTLDRQVVEERVPLPQRWVRGFAEAQAAGAGLVERITITAAEARRFLSALPRADSSASALFVVAGRRGLRLASSVAQGAVPLGGPSRLRIIEPMLRYASAVTLYGPSDPDGPGVSLWQLALPSALLTVAMSPVANRGFSGEGGLLHQLADEAAERAAATILAIVGDGAPVELSELARASALPQEVTRAGLAWLAAQGRVGFDPATQTYFHRELPWDDRGAHRLNPRLVRAVELVDAGAVYLLDPDTAEIRHRDSRHRVRGGGEGATCTCPWTARNGRSRGPCTHILAVRVTRARAAEAASDAV